MQYRKQLVKRAAVSPPAMEYVREVVSFSARRLKAKISRYGFLNAAEIQAARAVQNFNLEQVRSNLMGLPFVEFGRIQTAAGRDLLYGKTKDILCAEIAGMNHGVDGRKWEMGPYTVYLPIDIWPQLHYSGMHLVPDRLPEGDTARHWHHYGDSLEYDGGWCAAQFSSMFVSCMQVLDFPGVFRVVNRFLSTYYAGSPLARPTFGKVIDESRF